jgi:hypothetical protein
MSRFPSGHSWWLLLALAGPTPAKAQASPYLPTDDPRMPLIEHLIARGDITDPSPLERPLRKGELVAALRLSSSAAAKRLAEELAPARNGRWGRYEVKAGAQAYTQGRRDLLQAGGEGDPGVYSEVQVEFSAGHLVIAGRSLLDSRLSHDPDYVYSRSTFPFVRVKNVRMADLYLGIQAGWGEIFLGQMARNWGPAGIPGVPISDAAVPHPDIGLRLGRGAIRFSSLATRLRSTQSAAARIERYFVAHRLAVGLGRSLTIAAWEVGIIAGTPDQLDGTTRATVPLLVIPALLASRSHRNEMVGGDISWRPAPNLRVEAQLAIDDWNFDANNPYPQRWAGALTGTGALGKSASWRASYTTASSLAFRTLNPEENIVDQGIGIGRLFPDNEVVEVSVGIPVAGRWLVAPKLALLRQGEGRIQDPFPTPAEAPTVPARFIGVTAKSFWAGIGVSGGHQRLQVSGEGGLRHTRNAGHVAGRTSTTLEGRVTATLGLTLWKANR